MTLPVHQKTSALQRQILFWVSLFVVLLLALWLLRSVLLPFVAGLILAYLLNPLAQRLQKLGLNRLTAVVLILLVFTLIFTLTLIILTPMLGQQMVAFVGAMPGYLTKFHGYLSERLALMKDNPVAQYVVAHMGDASQSVANFAADGAGLLGQFLTSLWAGGQALLSILSLLIVAPVVAFYILFDWDEMIATVDRWLPRTHLTTIRALARDIDTVIAAFLRGQALVFLILGLIYGIGLSMAGLNFGLLIGVGAGVLSFIPYVGTLTGFIVSMIVAIVQYWPEWSPIALIAGIFLAGQVVDGYVLQPRLIGKSVGLHPVWLMVALVSFGSLFGFAGLLLAVPVSASMGILLRFAIVRYMQSEFYTGKPVASVSDDRA